MQYLWHQIGLRLYIIINSLDEEHMLTAEQIIVQKNMSDSDLFINEINCYYDFKSTPCE